MSIDADEIAPGLWQGSRPRPSPHLLRRFDVIVLCAREHQPPATHFPGAVVIHAPFDDAHEISAHAWMRASRAAEHVARHLQRGRRVLVTCNAGLNRSGLVSALALCRLTGLSGRECASVVQERRHRALCNDYFVRLLSGIPGRGSERDQERALARFVRATPSPPP